jgi:NAD-dependent DNA ligase
MMSAPLKISALYTLAGIVWILASDTVVSAMVPADEQITVLQSLKGIVFVLVTAAILFALTRHYFQKMEAAREEKEAVFASTVDAANIILKNFLNDMIYFRMVAEDTPFIEKEVIAEYDRVINNTSDKLDQLASLGTVSADDIREWALRETQGTSTAPSDDDPEPLGRPRRRD